MKIFLNLKEKIIDKVFCAQRNSFFITIFIFVIILILALIVWRDCVLSPKPGQIALENILKAENEYEKKINNIKNNNQKIEELIERLNNPQNNLEIDRNYFKPIFSDLNLENKQSQSKNFNPNLFN